MLNKDINERFEDWLLNPSESLDFEVKGWLNINNGNIEDRGILAKALIALENHGGGFLIIGFSSNDEKKLIPDEKNRPETLDQYNIDNINSIIAKFAEPKFHADITFQKHPETNKEFPFIRVHGNSHIPIRSCSETPKNSIRLNKFYTRRQGPSSDEPRDGIEWDKLIKRCVLNQRTNIVEMLRSFVPTGKDATSILNQYSELENFCDISKAKWEKINNNLNDTDPAKIKLGYFSFGCQIIGNSKKISKSQILSAVENLKKYTGWPIFAVLHGVETYPSIQGDCIEASFTKLKYHSDSAHADYWRIHENGFMYILRGYQEDCFDNMEPGRGFELTLPVWRIGEFLLRSQELGQKMFEEGFSMLISCSWNGLENRELFVHNSMIHLNDGRICKDSSTETKGKFEEIAITNLLPDVVKQLTAPLYEKFDFLELGDQFYSTQVEKMKTGR